MLISHQDGQEDETMTNAIMEIRSVYGSMVWYGRCIVTFT